MLSVKVHWNPLNVQFYKEHLESKQQDVNSISPMELSSTLERRILLPDFWIEVFRNLRVYSDLMSSF